MNHFYCQLSFESKHGRSFISVLSSNNKVYLCTFVFHVGIPFCFCVLFRSLMYMFQILCLSLFILVLNYCACNFDRNGWIVGLGPSLPLVVTDERITWELLVKVNCWIKNLKCPVMSCDFLNVHYHSVKLIFTVGLSQCPLMESFLIQLLLWWHSRMLNFLIGNTVHVGLVALAHV